MNIGDKIKAKCPKCENGCEECQDGYIEVFFGKKGMVMWALICNNCEEEAGGGFDEPERFNPEKISPYARCPFCGGSNLRKELME